MYIRSGLGATVLPGSAQLGIPEWCDWVPFPNRFIEACKPRPVALPPSVTTPPAAPKCYPDELPEDCALRMGTWTPTAMIGATREESRRRQAETDAVRRASSGQAGGEAAILAAVLACQDKGGRWIEGECKTDGGPSGLAWVALAIGAALLLRG